MNRKLYVHLLSLFLSLSISGCKNPPTEPSDDHIVDVSRMVGVTVLESDSDEWQVCIVAECLVYAEAVKTRMPEPWQLPTRDDAAVLKTLSFEHGERFITSDGYTFGMPSASVSKAGAKTKYSVLGLWKRRTVIDVPF